MPSTSATGTWKNGLTFKAAEFIQKAGEFSSIYAKHEKSVQKYYDEVLAFFHEIEE